MDSNIHTFRLFFSRHVETPPCPSPPHINISITRNRPLNIYLFKKSWDLLSTKDSNIHTFRQFFSPYEDTTLPFPATYQHFNFLKNLCASFLPSAMPLESLGLCRACAVYETCAVRNLHLVFSFWTDKIRYRRIVSLMEIGADRIWKWNSKLDICLYGTTLQRTMWPTLIRNRSV